MIIGAVIGVVLIIQFINIGVSTNPPVGTEVPAPLEVRQVLRRACYDCHSNETAWPWYSRVAPSKWLVRHDVAEGRAKLNFSTWGGYSAQEQARKALAVARVVQRGAMPPRLYTPLHPTAQLTAAERERIIHWADTLATRIATEQGLDLNRLRQRRDSAGNRDDAGGG